MNQIVKALLYHYFPKQHRQHKQCIANTLDTLGHPILITPYYVRIIYPTPCVCRISMEPLFEELQCPVCLETYNCPVILPCSHILCRSPCAERLLNHGFVRCPVCRDNSYVADGVQSFPRVISIENIISRLKQPRPETDLCRPGDTPCQLCQQVGQRLFHL